MRRNFPQTGRAPIVAALIFLAATLLILLGVPVSAAEEPLLRTVLGNADHFADPSGTPPAAAAIRDDKIIGYVFHTELVVASAGFSGKPLDVLVGLDVAGHITGARLLHHQEPILVIGVADQDLHDFVAQYTGLDIRNPARVLRGNRGGPGALTAVSGATISSIVINDSILRAARAVARSRGLLGDTAGNLDFEAFERASWPQLLEDKSLVTRMITNGEISRVLAGNEASSAAPPGADSEGVFIDLVLGLATPARVGRNLLGDRIFNGILAGLKAGDQLVFIGANGRYSFKGTAYARDGLFDRIQIVQEDHTFRFAREDHVRVDKIEALRASELREAGIFILRQSTGFDPARPWRLDLLVSAERGEGRLALASVPISYQLPARYFRKVAETAPEPPIWRQVWESRITDAATLIVILMGLTGLIVFQDFLARRPKAYLTIRIGFLLVSLIWLGWYSAAQLSVLNVLTFAEALRTEFHWDFFLLEPLIFVLWGYVALTLVFWGRGIFCGWICPFGALQELASRLARWARLPQWRLPFGLHERIWPIKYVVFMGLFAISLGNMALAQIAAEAEPFKTAIVLGFVRQWPFVAYATLLLGLGLFVERFFCRYICPLGGALALPARMRMFEWLKRRWQCGIQCQVCANSCPVQAIHPDGRINPNECIYCLNCQVIYYDDTVCPPLAERRKRNESRLTKRLIDQYEAAERSSETAAATSSDTAKDRQ